MSTLAAENRTSRWVSRALSGRIAHQLGQWSYSIYMTHAAVAAGFWAAREPLGLGQRGGILVATGPIPGDILVLAYVGVVLGVSAFTFRFVEEPARRYFNGLASPKAKVLVHVR